MNALVISTIVAAASAVATNDHRLLFVAFVHRHGDRSPIGTYPNDPHGNESSWNNGWGELTNAGKVRAHDLGKWLRRRYASFLPERYDKNDYEARSTDANRALMSGSLVLAGLYEPRGSDVWHPDVNWQPIPLHATPGPLDAVLAVGKSCPKRTKLLLQLMLSEEITARLEPIADALAEVVRHAGYNSTNLQADFAVAASVCDSLKVQHENGLDLPEWSKRFYPRPLLDASALMLRLSTFNVPLQRLGCGLLVGEILENLKKKAAGTLRKKMWQYSAHDVTIVGLRQCLGFRETDSPPYASALVLELSHSRGEHYVKVSYKAGDATRTMVVPGCDEYCPLDKFAALVGPVVPDDWDEECRL